MNYTCNKPTRKISLTSITDQFWVSTIDYGWVKSPFGPALIFSFEQCIIGIAFGQLKDREAIEVEMKSIWKKAIFQENLNLTTYLGQEVFYGMSNITVMLLGTNFQKKVWYSLLDISFGKTATYSDIAATLKMPNSARAVANAIGRNPVAWLIPCHRIVRKSAALGGYRWGVSLKQKML